jgi:hypothetical protein
VIHLNRDQNLRIKKSTVPSAGLGLFSGDKPIAKNQNVVPYTGQYSPTEVGGNYVLEINKKHYINGNRHIDTAAFANECRQSNKRTNQCSGNNTRFALNRKKKQAWIKTTKVIPPATEVFVPYGEAYWRSVEHKTKLSTNVVKQKKTRDRRRKRVDTIALSKESIVF